jgi:(E)-4-hydroxy-3-methylbut-2-enyl-diphosphate synthase
LRELAARCDRVTLRLPPGADNAPEAVEALAVSGCRAAHLQLRLPDSPGISVDPLVAAATRFRDLAGTVPLVSLETPPGISPVPAYRLLSLRLREASLPAPILLVANPAGRGEDPLLFCSTYLGSLLCDGIGDAVRVERFGTPADSLRLAFNILQGTRLRLFKTEFISCPSCGRTQFDLEETTRRIKAGTSHLKGVKIAIMGCIVNGPGEMADADFGYVGWGPGKVALFVGKDLVEKDIPFAEADDRLIRLIRERGRWIEPGSPETAPGPVQELGGS